MTPEDPESRRVADALARRERRTRQSEQSLDAATLRAILEQHEGEVARIVGQAEAACVAKIDALAAAQGAAAENLRREIAERMEGNGTTGTAALEGRLKEDQRLALEALSAGLKREFDGLKASLDDREGGVFAEIDRVAEKVLPAASALASLQRDVARAASAARDVADIKDAVAGGRHASDEVATIRQIAADMVTMRPVLAAVAREYRTSGTGARGWLWFAWTMVAFVAVAFYAAGLWTQMETGLWPPPAGSDDYWRDLVWGLYREQLAPCLRAGLTHEPGMTCTIGGIDR